MYFDMGCAVKCLIRFVAQPLVVVFSFLLGSFDKRVRFHLFIGLSLYISLKSCFSPFIVCEMPFVLFHFSYTLMRNVFENRQKTNDTAAAKERHLVSLFGSISFPRRAA